jgi:hypothetical protein
LIELLGFSGSEWHSLQEHCSPEMVERLTAIIRAQQAQVCICCLCLLPQLCFLTPQCNTSRTSRCGGDVELADIKFLEDDPVIVVQFNCQQVGL